MKMPRQILSFMWLHMLKVWISHGAPWLQTFIFPFFTCWCCLALQKATPQKLFCQHDSKVLYWHLLYFQVWTGNHCKVSHHVLGKLIQYCHRFSEFGKSAKSCPMSTVLWLYWNNRSFAPKWSKFFHRKWPFMW